MTNHKDEIIAVNAAFYKAFSKSDMDKMIAIWSDKANISVIHPGHHLLQGYEDVMASWNDILSTGTTIKISCCNVEIFQQDSVGYVVCNELLAGHTLIATNIYLLDAGAWKLIHHQAGPAPAINENVSAKNIH